jgi:YaiO family outer membrane protein
MNTQRFCSFLLLSFCFLLGNTTILLAQDTSRTNGAEDVETNNMDDEAKNEDTLFDRPAHLIGGEEYPLDWEKQYRWRTGVSLRYLDWSKNRDSWNRQQVEAGYNRPGGGVYYLQGRRYDRGQGSEHSIGVDAYPPLWGNAYANVTYRWSPDPESIPRNDIAATLYQPVSKRWKVFPGYRKLTFPIEDVDIVSFGVGHYIGNWFLRSKLLYTDEDDPGVSLDLNARYYFSRDHRFELGASVGEETIGYYQEDAVENRDTQVYRAQYQNYFTSNLGIDVELRYRDMEGLPKARMAIIGLNYRFGEFNPSDVK